MPTFQAFLYPDLLNLYGDRGNIACLRQRLLWRGIDAQVTEYAGHPDEADADAGPVFVRSDKSYFDNALFIGDSRTEDLGQFVREFQKALDFIKLNAPKQDKQEKQEN